MKRLLVDAGPLLQRWREDIPILRRYGAGAEADWLEERACELEAAAREWMLEELTISEGALEAGVSYDTLQRWLADGKVENVGEKHRPRARRCDLPQVAAQPASHVTPFGNPDLAAEVLRARG